MDMFSQSAGRTTTAKKDNHGLCVSTAHVLDDKFGDVQRGEGIPSMHGEPTRHIGSARHMVYIMVLATYSTATATRA